MKKVVIITESIPHCDHGGGGITAYTALRAFVENKYAVTLIALEKGCEKRHIEQLKELQVTYFIVNKNELKNKFNLQELILFFLFKKVPKEEVKKIIDTVQPNLIFTYGWHPLVAIHGLQQYQKFATVGDPINLPYLFRRAFEQKYLSESSFFISSWRSLKSLIKSKIWDWAMVMLLNDCNERGAFAAHHAQHFVKLGVKNCFYLRTPVPDPLEKQSSYQLPQRLRILHIGHLQGIATLSGVELLVQKIIPEMQRLNKDFELRLVGGNFEKVPEKLKEEIRNHPSIVVCGQVIPPHEEFLTAHCVLVPTPIELGIRVRIITAFSYGCCVVCHSANQKGIPELLHNENCLMSEDARVLAKFCHDIYVDPSLRTKLAKNARITYEQFFSIENAGRDLVQKIAIDC